jgi:hypothetical protein
MSGSVAEIMQGMQAEVARGEADVMQRYVELVNKAAAGPLDRDAAVVAASIAYELGMQPDRFDRDVRTVKAERALAAQLVEDDKARETSTADLHACRDMIRALEEEIKAARLRAHRIEGEGQARVTRRMEHARLQSDNAHLFKPAESLSDNDWKAVRQ